jgi:hypothetical protein
MQVMSDPKTGSLAFAWPEGYDMNEWIGEHMEVSPSAVVIWIIAMWRLMQQTITDVRTEAVDRPLRKAARKRNMKSDEVSVIALRKRKYIDGEGESNIEWSHRWLVRGHWRKQPCKTNGEPDTRVIWIHPHIKGPEDKPLLVGDGRQDVQDAPGGRTRLGGGRDLRAQDRLQVRGVGRPRRSGDDGQGLQGAGGVSLHVVRRLAHRPGHHSRGAACGDRAAGLGLENSE